MAANRESLSQKTQKRGNRILLIIGILLLLLFLLALCQLQDETEVVETSPIGNEGGIIRGSLDAPDPEPDPTPVFADGSAQLLVTPNKVVMDKVVVGQVDEFPITLRAQNAPVKLLGKKLEIEKEDNFQLSGECMEKDLLEMGHSCTLIVSWMPEKVRSIHNTLDLRWMEDNPRVFREEHTAIELSANSSDSKDCTCCKCDEKSAPAIPSEAVKINGDPVQVNPKGKVIIDGQEIEPVDNVVIDPKTKKIIAVVQPETVPLSLKNELLGSVLDNRDVVDFNGSKIGHLLGDDTIVNEKFEIIGKAIPHVPAMTEKGDVIAKMEVNLNDKTVYMVDGKKKVVGRPLIDGRVVDLDGKDIAYLSPWGLVMDFQGKILGAIRPDGKVIDSQNKVVAYMRPMGLALSKNGGLVGGVVPRGVVVGSSCKSYGMISMNGQVKDGFNQSVGHVLLDKTVVNAQSNEIGSVVRQGLVIDSKAQPVGFVNSAGKAVNAKGELIGCINPDGSVFAKDKFVGAIMPVGRVIRDACGQVGAVYPNGQVMDDEFKVVGRVYPDAQVLDDKKKYLGMVAPTGTAIAPDCQLLGLISLKGVVVSPEALQVGCISRTKEVMNTNGEVIGQVTPMGIMMDDQNKLIGRVALDGQIYDSKGAVLGCVNSSKKIQTVLSNRGVVIDENGRSTGWSFVGGKVFDASSNWIGDVYSNGYVIGANHQMVGYVPISGPIFTDKGDVIGSYDQMSGLTTKTSGEILGRVLPGKSVINESGTEVVGVLIETGTTFVDLNGMILGTLQSDGTLINQNQIVEGKVYANGLVRNAEGKILGAMVRSGAVLNTAGQFVGLAKNNTEVVNEKAQKIGRVLANGLAVSTENKVLGMVFPSIAVPVSIEGSLGSVMPQQVGKEGSVAYQGQVNDIKGNLVGVVAAGGAILGGDNSVKGHLVDLNVFMDEQSRLIGWANFVGGVNNPDGRPFANILPSGMAVGSGREFLGRVVSHQIAVDTVGQFLGTVSSRGEFLSETGEKMTRLGDSIFLYDDQGILMGRLLDPGIAVDNNGQVMGWTRYDGKIENGTKVVGQVGLDGHVFDENGVMVGRYLPIGMVGFTDMGKVAGLINEAGELQDASGVVVGRSDTYPFAHLKNGTLGRFLELGLFATHMNNGQTLGMLSDMGQLMSFAQSKIDGQAMSNTFVANNTAQITGGIVPMGIATATTLGALGIPKINGQLFGDRKLTGNVAGNTVIYSSNGEVVGGVYQPAVIIDKKGSVAGTTGGTSGVFVQGKQVGHKLAFASALSPDSQWLGNVMPTGAVVDIDAKPVGVITADGSVIKTDGSFVGQILPDGAMAQVAQKGILNTMPYGGHTVAQGLPYGYNKKVLGRTNISGDVLDGANQKLYRILDTGLILGKEQPLSGVVLPFMTAVGYEGEVLGSLSHTGEVVSYKGDVVGPIANNGAVKGDNQFKNLGALVPEPLIVNNCKVVGQTAYDGRVINGQGSVVGRIRPDKWVVDAQGKEIGRTVRTGPVMSPRGEYLGRTLPDSTVVDVNGVEMACAKNDGSVETFDGRDIGHVVEAAPVFAPDGTMIGYSTSLGTVKDVNQKVIGTVLGDGKGTVIDPLGNVLGRVVSREEELVLDDKGHLTYTLGLNGEVKNAQGDVLFNVNLQNGEVRTLDNQVCPSMIYAQGLGCLQGCDLIGLDGDKIASIQADGTMLGADGELYASLLPDGQIFAPNGSFMGKFIGISVSFKHCGLADSAGGAGRRTIVWGNQTYVVDPDGVVLDEDNNIVGTWKDGRLFDLSGKPLSPEAVNGRERPPEPKPMKIDPEQIDAIHDIIRQKRASMRESLGKGTLLIPGAELQARSKPKKDQDWSRVGIEKTNISTWPVDMSNVILQGKAIRGVLARPIDSRYSDSPALGIVESNVYGEEGRNILIPAGSRLIGSFSSGAGVDGVAKIDIQWSRLIRPDGVAFNLQGSSSGDVMGRGGIAAYLDKQLWNKYGMPFLNTLATNMIIDLNTGNGEVAASSASTGTISEKAAARQEKRQNWIDLSDEIMQKLIDEVEGIPPVVYVPAGTKFVVFAREDLWLRSVEDDEKEVANEFGERPTAAQRPKTVEPADLRKKSQPKEDVKTTVKENNRKNKNKKSEPEPLYNGPEDMPEDIDDRVVQPVQNTQTQPL